MKLIGHHVNYISIKKTEHYQLTEALHMLIPNDSPEVTTILVCKIISLLFPVVLLLIFCIPTSHRCVLPSWDFSEIILYLLAYFYTNLLEHSIIFKTQECCMKL